MKNICIDNRYDLRHEHGTNISGISLFEEEGERNIEEKKSQIAENRVPDPDDHELYWH